MWIRVFNRDGAEDVDLRLDKMRATIDQLGVDVGVGTLFRNMLEGLSSLHSLTEGYSLFALNTTTLIFDRITW